MKLRIGTTASNIILDESGDTTTFPKDVTFNERVIFQQGGNIASANNLTLDGAGNIFYITGTTQINLINRASWAIGAEITLVFQDVVTIKYNQTESGTNTPIELPNGVDYVTQALDVVTLVLINEGSVNLWLTKSISTNAV